MSLRVGLVGAGGVAARHARTLSGFPDVELVAVTDPAAGAAAELAASVGAGVAADLPQLLAAGLDAVWVCVPPFAHGELELAVLRAGLPLFVEKPLAADLAVAEQVAAAVAASGLPTATGYHWRHLDTVELARTALAGAAPTLVSARWWGTTPPPAWWSRTTGSGGQVVEQATHVLDLLRLLAGEVVEVVGAQTSSTAEGRDVPDGTAAVLRLAGGGVGLVSTSCVLPVATAAGVDVVVPGTVVQLTETDLHVRTADAEQHVRPEVDARTAVDRAFVDLLQGAPAPAGLVDVAEALRTHRLAWAVAEATRTGRPVRPADAGGAR